MKFRCNYVVARSLDRPGYLRCIDGFPSRVLEIESRGLCVHSEAALFAQLWCNSAHVPVAVIALSPRPSTAARGRRDVAYVENVSPARKKLHAKIS